MKTLKRLLTLLLTVALFAGLLPSELFASLPGASASVALAAGEAQERQSIPVRALTDAQLENAQSIAALLTSRGSEAVDGDFRYVLLADGTAAITGYTGSSFSVSIPLTLSGADVVAIASGAFGQGVLQVTIHGNVLYIDEGAFPAQVAVRAWQGSYAAAWAQKNGLALESKTEGVLLADAIDMTDVVDRVAILSETTLSLGITEARRLVVGDSFLLNRGGSDEVFFTVAAMRKVGTKVYMTVRSADIGQIYSHRVYEGETSVTKTFTQEDEVGVDMTEGDIQASETLERSPYTTKSPTLNKSDTISLSKNVKLSISFKQTTESTTSYRVEVVNGTIISGTMTTDQTHERTVEIKLSNKLKGGSFTDGRLYWSPFIKKEATRKKTIENLLSFKGEETNKKLGSYDIFICPGVYLQISPTYSISCGGTGKFVYQDRTLTKYDYDCFKEAWVEDKNATKALPTPDPQITGMIWATVSVGINVNLVCLYVTSELHASLTSTLKIELSLPVLDSACATFKINYSITASFEVGLWATLGPLEAQVIPSLYSYTITLLNISLVDMHYSGSQGLHRASRCNYSPMDYALRFDTGTSWNPDPVCYLKPECYTYNPFPVTVLEFNSDGFRQIPEPDTVVKSSYIDFSFGDDAQNCVGWTMTLPQPSEGDFAFTPYGSVKTHDYSNSFVRWRVIDPAPIGEYYWDENKTVQANIEAVIGKSIAKEDDLPKVITLEAVWSDKYSITFDANGGYFKSGRKDVNTLTAYYAPGEIVKDPINLPFKTMAQFNGTWTLDIAGTQPWTSGAPLTENLTLYAQYDDFDVTNHQTVNTRYPATPTLIGNVTAQEPEYVNWTISISLESGLMPVEKPIGSETLNDVLKDGVDAYAQTFGSIVCSTPELRNVKGRLVSPNSGDKYIELTGLLDDTVTYDTFTVPSTINDIPVMVSSGLLQKLRARTVRFGAATDSPLQQVSSSAWLFYNNQYIEYVYMDNTKIVELSSYAFKDCKNLKGVTLPGTLQKIGEEAFMNCEGITTVTFGRHVDTVGGSAFRGCTNLLFVMVDTPYLISMSDAFWEDGLHIPAHIDLLLGPNVVVVPDRAFSRGDAIKSVTVWPDSKLREIGAWAFVGCSGLEQIALNEGLQKIGKGAFMDSKIEEVVIPSTVSDYGHGDGTWDNPFSCGALKKITIGGALTEVDRYTFGTGGNDNDKYRLQEVILRDGVTTIGEDTFYFVSATDTHAPSLQKVRLPETLTTIGSRAFYNCVNLEKIGVDPERQKESLVLPSGVTEIPSEAFYNCKQLKKLKIDSVKSIGSRAFYNCINLTDPGLPEGLERIESAAFRSTAITEVVIPSTVSYFYGAPGTYTNYSPDNHPFSHNNLTKITIGGALTTVGRCTFDNYNQHLLTEVVLRDGVTTIDEYTFQTSTNTTGYYVSKLQRVRLPKTLTSIGMGAFDNCINLEKVGVDPDNQTASVVLPSGITEIQSYTFENCKALISVSMTSAVKTIRYYAFYGCSALKNPGLVEGLERIESGAFASTAITKVEIPSTVSYFSSAPGTYTNYNPANHPFANDKITSITIGGALTTVGGCMFDNRYKHLLTEVVLRDGVTTIEDSTFYFSSTTGSEVSSLQRVQLPKTLTSIGYGAFQNCIHLEKVGVDPDAQTASVVLPSGVTEIRGSTFENCKALISVSMTSAVKSIRYNAFSGCIALTNPGLVEGLERIEFAAFANTAITKVEIPSTVSYFYGAPGTYTNYKPASHPFANDKITSITIGGALTTVGGCTFDNNYRHLLTEVVLRDGVTTIDYQTFYFEKATSNPNLQTVWLPESLTTIGSYAFQNCINLDTIYVGSGLSSIGSNAFKNAHPTFARLPGSADNAWLANWCSTNGFNYLIDAVMRVFVTFDDGLGEIAAASVVTVDAFDKIEEPETPTREGYAFLGWYLPGSSERWNFAADRVGAFDVTLTARWMKESVNGLYRVEDGRAILTSYALAEGESTIVALPPQWRGYPVTGIDDGAFDGEAITGLILPEGIEGLRAQTFAGAEQLYWVEGARYGQYATQNSILFSKDMTRLIFCPPALQLAEYTLPESVTTIEAYAFRGHDELTRVTFNEGLTEIGDYAFYGCDGLYALELPDSLARIGAGAFQACLNLKVISGAANCVYIGGNAFAGSDTCIFRGEEDSALARYAAANDRLWNIYEVTYLVDGEQVALRRVKAGEVVYDLVLTQEDSIIRGWYTDAELSAPWDFASGRMPLGDVALYGTALPIYVTQTVTAASEDGEDGERVDVGVRITQYNGLETDISLPEKLGDAAVCALDAEAFPTGCTLRLPGELLELDVDAFIQRNITLYAPIGSATEQLLLAAEYTLHVPVHTLSYETNGGALAASVEVAVGGEVTLPGSVRDDCTFAGWYADSKLTELVGQPGDSYTMPDGDVVLYAKWSGTARRYPFQWEQRGDTIVIVGSSGRAEVEIPDRINDLAVTEIAEGAFAGDTVLTQITLPETLTAIGDYAFRESGIVELALPDAVESVGKYAFSGCKNLLSFAWNDTVAELSEGVLLGDSALKWLTLPEGITAIGAYALCGCADISTLTLPESVRTIGAGAFHGMTGLTALKLGANVTTISTEAFSRCTALKNITVAAGNPHFESVDGVLYYAGRAGLVKYPAGKAAQTYAVDTAAAFIEANAFAGANHLREVNLPAGLVSLGREAFADSGLQAIDLSALEQLTELPEGAFLGCASLAEVDVPDRITQIGSGAFDDWTTLIVGADSAALRFAREWALNYRLRGAVIVPAQEITASKASLTLLVGVGYQMEAEIQPADSTDGLVWGSGDRNILRVDDGYIRPLKVGETEIAINAGNVELTIPVRVVASSVAIEPDAGWVFSSAPLQLTLRNDLTDNSAGATAMSWSCDGSSISFGGLLTASETGIATVRVTATDGSTDEKRFACIVEETALSMPAMIRQIDDEAFLGNTALRCVIIPDGATSIGAHAFGNCSSLRIACIPVSVTAIDGTAFENCPSLTIVCPAGSAAEQFAKENGIDCYTVE